MRDGWWGGKPQKNYSLGIPKRNESNFGGERSGHSRDEANNMRAVMGSHPDFKNENSTIEQFLADER